MSTRRPAETAAYAAMAPPKPLPITSTSQPSRVDASPIHRTPAALVSARARYGRERPARAPKGASRGPAARTIRIGRRGPPRTRRRNPSVRRRVTPGDEHAPPVVVHERDAAAARDREDHPA